MKTFRFLKACVMPTVIFWRWSARVVKGTPLCRMQKGGFNGKREYHRLLGTYLAKAVMMHSLFLGIILIR